MSESDKINILKKRRSVLRTAVTKFLNKLENSLQLEDVSIEELEENLDTLNSKFNSLKITDGELELLVDPTELEREIETSEKYADNIILFRANANKKIRELKAELSSENLKQEKVTSDHSLDTEICSKNTQNRVKLPKLSIVRFGGSVNEWLSFWSTFESSIHNNSSLSKVDKFNYLKAHLHGTALNTVVGLPISEKNYDSAIDLLKDRFGNEQVLIHNHMNNILEIKPLRNSSDIHAFRKFYDKISTELRSLESLGTNLENISTILCTTILKSIPQDLVIELNKSDQKAFYNINDLLNFLSASLKAREKAALVSVSVNETIRKPTFPTSKINNRDFASHKPRNIPTASDLVSTNVYENFINAKCVFCDAVHHESSKCKHALELSLEQRKEILMKKGACFKCLDRKKHLAKFCRKNIVCSHCKGNHNSLFCFTFYGSKRKEATKTENECSETSLLSYQSFPKTVFLQTLIARVKNQGAEYLVRVILDTASSKSYVSKFVAEKLNLKSFGKLQVTHGLFGGSEKTVSHDRYFINLMGLNEIENVKIEVMEQEKICATVPRIRNVNCINELREKQIFLSDICSKSIDCLYEYDCNEIHVLLGADVVGKLFTGKIENLSCGLVAVQTRLGWTAMGKINDCEDDSNSSLLVLSLFINDAKITDLWNLDSLGITDPAVKQSREEVQNLVLEKFEETVTREMDGRYKVSLPWIEERPSIPDNKDLALKRLKNNVKNLNSSGLLKNYQQVFDEWEEEGVIREVKLPENLKSNESVHYLPHRAVIKPNSTTQIRPVFDGGAHVKGFGSINDCLEKGPNLIELIPSVLNRFRMGEIGVVADIRRAFLQISLNELDRKYLRFLWWRDGDPENLVIYEHCRVVFGISSSPFLLAATLIHHLDRAPENVKDVALKLKESLYVDNCVASVESLEELEYFRNEARKLLASAKFDLRGWCHNQYVKSNLDKVGSFDSSFGSDNLSNENNDKIPLLGLLWDTKNDTLACDFRNFKLEVESITKRTILSVTHKIFDPIGFTCPLTLIPKLILQKCWKIKISWDSKLPDDIIKEFKNWIAQMSCLENLVIPRRLSDFSLSKGKLSIHVFCDASKYSYATCVFIRNELFEHVTCQLVQARSRVAPLKEISIPRLELLACCIGARLADTVIHDLKLETVDRYYWSDSMDVLHWIKGDGPWGVFIANRVKEIRRLSLTSSWRFVPGNMNPADLPSRGCGAKKLIESQWWLGPSWLLQSQENWPKIEIIPNMDIVNAEKRKTKVTNAVNFDNTNTNFYNHYSSYTKILRVTSWILRFIQNSKRKIENRTFGQLNCNELKNAENVILKLVQRESFTDISDSRLKSLRTIIDSEGFIRVKTKIFMREDEFNFRLPIVLPSNHNVVQQLIFWKHKEMGHCGVQLLMSVLREKYWILKSRKTIKRVISKCVVCKRFSSKPPEVSESVLPVDRVRNAAPFEIIGIDLAGPLYLKDKSKVWVLLVTCAVYRAVHLELLTSLSTDAFMLGLSRFIARRGRPSIIYSDNGKNFIGGKNLLESINLEKLKSLDAFSIIEWRLIPPSAPWWGGFWERLVGIMKRILKKILWKSSLNFEELSTILCKCESIMNSRPLTYVSDDIDDLTPLTPAMFLSGTTEIGIPELELLDNKKMNKRYIYRLKVSKDLYSRFRSEYLSNLKMPPFSGKNKPLKIGDVVIIWTENNNRLHWPLGQITELCTSNDGVVRVAKVRTANGTLVRPLKKLFNLELSNISDNPEQFLIARQRRTARPPDRLQLS